MFFLFAKRGFWCNRPEQTVDFLKMQPSCAMRIELCKSLPPLTHSLSRALCLSTSQFVSFRQLFTHFKCISNKNCDISRWAEPTVNRFTLNASGVCFFCTCFCVIPAEYATAAPIITKSATIFSLFPIAMAISITSHTIQELQESDGMQIKFSKCGGERKKGEKRDGAGKEKKGGKTIEILRKKKRERERVEDKESEMLGLHCGKCLFN